MSDPSNTAITQCEHSDTRVEILPADSKHYAKEICRNCDRVLRFVPKPENIERRRVTAYRVAMLANLSPWRNENPPEADHTDGRFIVRADEKLTAFLELDRRSACKAMPYMEIRLCLTRPIYTVSFKTLFRLVQSQGQPSRERKTKT